MEHTLRCNRCSHRIPFPYTTVQQTRQQTTQQTQQQTTQQTQQRKQTQRQQTKSHFNSCTTKEKKKYFRIVDTGLLISTCTTRI